jgi:hypothetical protein
MPAKTTLKLRRDTAANWTSTNPTLAAGEPGFETDTKRLKIGDGSTAWTSLPYYRDTPIGGSQLIYRYTVAGSDKASIDTGVDTADAGSNDWTDGDVLEVFAITRTDEAAAAVNIDVTLNNTGGTVYDYDQLYESGNAPHGLNTNVSGAKWSFTSHGSGGSASNAASMALKIPNFTGTTFNKVGNVEIGTTDATAANQIVGLWAVGFRSTSAITRLKIAAQGAAKLKVGSQLLVYKRKAS